MARKLYRKRVGQIRRLIEASSELYCILQAVEPRPDGDLDTYLEIAESDNYDLISRNREMQKLRRLYNDYDIQGGTLSQRCGRYSRIVPR